MKNAIRNPRTWVPDRDVGADLSHIPQKATATKFKCCKTIRCGIWYLNNGYVRGEGGGNRYSERRLFFSLKACHILK